MNELTYSPLALLSGDGYRITTIEDEATPLAAGVPVTANYYGETILSLVFVAAVLLVGIYIGLCLTMQKRVRSLGGTTRNSWNFWKLREEAARLEDRRADEIIDQMRAAAEEYRTA